MPLEQDLAVVVAIHGDGEGSIGRNRRKCFAGVGINCGDIAGVADSEFCQVHMNRRRGGFAAIDDGDQQFAGLAPRGSVYLGRIG